MSQIDDQELKGTKSAGRSSVLSFNDQMAQEIGAVTSRDQIIDPYALVNPANYRKTRVGQAQYNSDLQQAQLYAERQEAAYQEWYNSPEQQAIRDREAGLNPNLLGLSGSESADTQMNSNSPIAGQKTNGEMAIEGINTVMNVIQSVVSVASLAAGIPNIGKQGDLIAAQTEAQQLANVSAFEQTAHNAIASKFATFHAAQTALGNAVDVGAYFADDNNFSDILPSYAPSDNPMYKHALDRVRKGSESILADAYKTNAEAASGQQSFARLLANPYANSNTVIMASFLEPLMNGIFELQEADTKFKTDAANFKSQAMSGVDAVSLGETWSESQESDALIKKSQSIIESVKSSVFENLKLLYLRDPNGPAGISAAAMIMGHFDNTLEASLVRFLQGLGNSTVTPISSPSVSPDELSDNEVIVNFGGKPRRIRDE